MRWGDRHARPAWRRATSAARLAAAVIVFVTATSGHASVPDVPDECEPVTVASVDAVAGRLGLDDEQRGWLRARLAAGRLREPGDLEGLPGLGPELREALRAAWCWSAPVAGRGLASRRWRRTGALEEVRLGLQRGESGFEGRWRRAEAGEAVLRGGGRLSRGSWRLLAGTLRARSGLGLLLVTPGAEPRGSSPPGPSPGDWRLSTTLDEAALTGVALGWRRAGLGVEGALLRGEMEVAGVVGPGWWQALSAVRAGPRGHLGLAVVGSAEGPAGALQVGRAMPGGRWDLELAWGVSGSAQAASWRLAPGPWRLRAGLGRRGGLYRLPTIRSLRVPPGEDEAALFLEGRWQGGPGRFVRVSAREAREPAPYGKTWSRVESERSLELGETFGSGLRVLFRWRSRERRSDGEPAAETGRERLARGDLVYRRLGWRCDVRLEERSAVAGRARLTTLRVGRRGRVTWEVGVGLAGEEGAGPDLWWYRRRAGGLYGWDRLSPGAWLGGWIRVPAGRWALEASADSRPGGWEGAVAFSLGLGRSGSS